METTQDLAELLSGQTCPLATNPQWEEAVALPISCELQPGQLENAGSGLEVALALGLHGCTAAAGSSVRAAASAWVHSRSGER